MTTSTIKLVKLTAAEGMTLTNGEAFGKEVYLGNKDSKENWREITDGEVLIKIISDSVCMSTYKTAKQGAKHIRVPDDIETNPVIVGHEFCGEIVKVGKRWENEYKVGEKIIIPPVLEYMGMSTIGYSFTDIGGASTYSIVYEHIIENGFLIKFNSDTFFKGSIIEPASCVLRGYKGSVHLKGDDYISGLKQNGKVAHIIPVYERDVVPEFFYEKHLSKPKLTKAQKDRIDEEFNRRKKHLKDQAA